MLGPNAVQELLERALAAVPAQIDGSATQRDAFLHAHDTALTRFANNSIHQNVAEHDLRVVVRVLFGKRLGLATTNDTSPAGLVRAAETAVAIARLRPENPDQPELPQPLAAPEIAACDDATASCTPERRARAVGEVCARAAERGLTAAGAFETGQIEQGVASSQGVRGYQTMTTADFQTVVMSADSSGWSHESAWQVDQLDVVALGDEAIRTADRGRGPREVAPGRYPVILAPSAVQDVVGMLAVPSAGALAVQEGRSWMSGRSGQTLLSPSVSIWDDGRNLEGIPSAFDSEGVPRQRVDIVRDGVIGDPVYDSLTAAREPGRRSTGHALPPLDPLAANWGPLPFNLFMATGGATLEDMIASTERGVFVTRFWYTRTVHPRDVIITGLTRDGTFWIENGELAYPIHNLRFTQAYLKALAGVEQIGSAARTLRGWLTTSRVPALKLSEFNFTGVSPRET
jgi:predicted Zn-dependent protease